MKTGLLLIFGALGAIVLVLCAPLPHEKETTQQAVRGLDVHGERIWMAPLVNNSNIHEIEGWPGDTLEQEVLLRQFDKIEIRLRAEMRRCGKYGLYTLVDDSASATMVMRVNIEGFTRQYDTVTIPVQVRLQGSRIHETDTQYEFKPTAPAQRALRQESPFHYVGMILKNYTNEFPYRDIARLFY